MSISNESTGSRRFEANPPFWGSGWARAWHKNPVTSYLLMVVGILAFSAVAGGLYMAAQHSVMRHSGPGATELTDKVLRYGFVALLLGGFGAWYKWRHRSGHGKFFVDVTGDALTVSKRPGDVYPLSDVKLGAWGVSGGMTMGAALHLHCGGRRFILGGRDYRVAPGTRFDAPDAGYGQSVDVDAWVTGTDFGEILTMAGRQNTQSRLAASPPAPGAPIRCLLFPSPLLIQQMGAFAYRKRQRVLQSVNQPRLAIDVGTDAIHVVDPNTNALVTSAQAAQVTATPETYQYRYGGFGYSFSPDRMMARSLSETPVMVLRFPGMQPLSIGCRDTVGGLDKRFSWPRDVRQRVNEPPDFSVSGADWLTLVEKFGLAPYLHRHDQQV
jgi:hypothetical protein